MNHKTDEADLEAGRQERQFDAMVEIFCKRYGITKDEIPELIEKAKWSGEHRDSISRVSWSATMGFLTLFVSGVGLLIWEGVKHTLTIKGGP